MREGAADFAAALSGIRTAAFDVRAICCDKLPRHRKNKKAGSDQ
jgi:hypothetical protein